MIACCTCGAEIEPDPPYNMCATCLRNHVDITADVTKQAVLQYCRSCERYLRPPTEWIPAALESRQLLGLCVKKLKGLKELQLVDAVFLYTEPHSKRLKVQLTVSTELSSGNKHQQTFVADYTVQNQMCNDCHRVEAKKYWQSLVQVRQRAENKKTFYYLEQLILKHKAHEHTLAVKPAHGGLDFYYATEHHARKLIDFLQSKVPVRSTFTKRLITHDVRNNRFYYKYTWLLDIARVSKDSAVCLSKRLRQQLGNLSPICLIQRVSTGIHIIDPLTAHVAELTGSSYFRAPFEAIFNPKQLVEYVVMDMDVIAQKARKSSPKSCPQTLCDIWLVRATALGLHDNAIHTRTHLGHLLQIGDSVLGYNLREANLNNLEYNKLSCEQIPDVVLVRKCYADRQTRRSQRRWKLQHLTQEATDERSKHDYQEFLEDLEEDAECRQQVNIYRNAQQPAEEDGVSSDNAPQIALSEMLEHLTVGEEKKTDS